MKDIDLICKLPRLVWRWCSTWQIVGFRPILGGSIIAWLPDQLQAVLEEMISILQATQGESGHNFGQTRRDMIENAAHQSAVLKGHYVIPVCGRMILLFELHQDRVKRKSYYN